MACRREERVQKAFSVDHHGPGDARLSHRATAIYGEHSDYVRAVWAAIAQTWQEATSEPLDVTNPTLTVLGLRPEQPGGGDSRAGARFRAREPAWRLLHAVTLLKLHQARALGPTWHTTTRKARASPARLTAQAHSPGHTPEVCAHGLL